MLIVFFVLKPSRMHWCIHILNTLSEIMHLSKLINSSCVDSHQRISAFNSNFSSASGEIKWCTSLISQFELQFQTHEATGFLPFLTAGKFLQNYCLSFTISPSLFLSSFLSSWIYFTIFLFFYNVSSRCI